MKKALALFGLLLVTGCMQHAKPVAHLPDDASVESRILLMPTDIELYELTAAGLLEPKADWTQSAKRHIDAAIRSNVEIRGERYVEYGNDGVIALEHSQLVKLHAAVGKTISVHAGPPALQLPSKNGTFDWGLGPDVALLREAYDADYALFVHVRDSYSSAGRVALTIAAAVFGVAAQGGQAVGFASLVDLRTGQIVWYSFNMPRNADLREFASAHSASESLLQDFPL